MMNLNLMALLIPLKTQLAERYPYDKAFTSRSQVSRSAADFQSTPCIIWYTSAFFSILSSYEGMCLISSNLHKGKLHNLLRYIMFLAYSSTDALFLQNLMMGHDYTRACM